MRTAWLCQIDAFDRVTGDARVVRVASHDDCRLCHLNGTVWWPAIARLPTLSYDFFDGAFGGDIVAPSGRADLSLGSVPGFAALMLHGARIRWWSGRLGAAWGDFVLRFDGIVDNQAVIRDGVASVDFRVDDRWLDDPILDTYEGTTGAEGEAALKGQAKPLALGKPRMCEGVLVNSISTIVQVNDGPIDAIDIAFEDAARFAAPVADYPDYAALDAATIAPGFVATALAAGLVRHGAPPAGVLTYDISGSNSGADGGGLVERTGAIVARLAARLGKLDKVDAAAMAAIDAAAPYDVALYLSQQATMRDIVKSMAQAINAVALVTWTGLLTILPVIRPEDATPIGKLASDGTALPPVAKVDQLGIAPPFWRVAIEAEITNRVHGNDEVRFYAPLVERGIYDDAETYREGNIVSIADGSRWLYVNVTPTAGNDPADGSSYWNRLSAAATGPEGPQGPPGVPGADGAPGAPGADGTPRYTWYAYADSLGPDWFNFDTGTPGGRTYQGIAANKTTATESTDPNDYDWSPYIGPPNFGLAAFNSNTVVSANKLIRVVGAANWDASIHSTESFKGGATVSFEVGAAALTEEMMVGLNTDPTTNSSFDTIDFAIYINSSSSVAIYESGSSPSSGFPAATVGDVFTVTYNGKAVVYSRNGVPFYTNSSPAPGLSLFLDSSLANGPGDYGRILSFAAAGTAGADGTDGADGSDGSDGADGRDAVAVRSDTTPTPPPGGFLDNDIWYQPTPKKLWQWGGGAWTQMLGDIASINAIIAANFVTDQGVDLAAVVPASLNTAVTASQGSAINLPIVANSPNTNDAAVVTSPSVSVVNAGDSIFVNGSVVATNGTARGQYQLQVQVNGGSWTTLQEISSTSNQGVPAGTYSFAMEYQNVVASTTLAFRILAEQRAAQNLGDGTAGTNWTTNSGAIRVRRFFSK